MIVIVSNQHHIIGSLIVCIILYINILVHDKPHSVKKSDHIPYSKANHRFQVCPDPCTAVTTPPNAVRMSVQRCTYNVTNHCALKNNNKQACLGGWTIIALLDRDELDYSQAAVSSDNFGGLVKTGRGWWCGGAGALMGGEARRAFLDDFPRKSAFLWTAAEKGEAVQL